LTLIFSLSRRLATSAVIGQLHAIGREVHVSTLNDKSGISQAMLDGADNIITSDPLLAAKVSGWFPRPGRPRLAADRPFPRNEPVARENLPAKHRPRPLNWKKWPNVTIATNASEGNSMARIRKAGPSHAGVNT
jgi:hypothetical protein